MLLVLQPASQAFGQVDFLALYDCILKVYLQKVIALFQRLALAMVNIFFA